MTRIAIAISALIISSVPAFAEHVPGESVQLPVPYALVVQGKNGTTEMCNAMREGYTPYEYIDTKIGEAVSLNFNEEERNAFEVSMKLAILGTLDECPAYANYVIRTIEAASDVSDSAQ